MTIRILFGRLCLNVAMRLMKLSARCIHGPIGTESTTEGTTKVWGILEGPYHIDDFPDAEDVPEQYEYMLVAKVEEEGKIGVCNLWYETLNDALDVKHYFDTNIEPLELENG